MSAARPVLLLLLLMVTRNGHAQLDYSDLDNWLFHPDKTFSLIRNYNLDIAVVNAQLATDSVIAVPNNSYADTGIDIFWVHPTYTAAPSNLEVTNVELSELPPTILGSIAIAQAGLLAQYGRFFAPRYRQASAPAFFLQGQDSLQADILENAYLDVKAAFLDYLDNHSNGNRFILAGHSQGSHMLSFLLRDVIDQDVDLRERMVAAALGGMAFYFAPPGEFSGGFYENIPFCTAVDQDQCVMMWRSYKADQDLPANGFAVPATNIEMVNRGYVYRQLDFASDYSYADSLVFGLEPAPLVNYILPVGFSSDLTPAGVRFAALNGMYEAAFERRGPFEHGLMVRYVAEAGDLRENDLGTLEDAPLWELSGYHTKDYNVYNWALIQQVNCKIGDCNLLTTSVAAPEVQNRQLIIGYPNPTTEQLKISSAVPLKEVVLYNSLGAIVLRRQGEALEVVDVAGLSAGVYLLQCTLEDGRSAMQRIMVE
ncbi:MAG: DUF3089 domain-containing protein [Bacteroidota bacterium]